MPKPYVHGKQVPPQPGDELAGDWTRARLIAMNQKFAARLERAFELGDENRQATAATHGATSTRYGPGKALR